MALKLSRCLDAKTVSESIACAGLRDGLVQRSSHQSPGLLDIAVRSTSHRGSNLGASLRRVGNKLVVPPPTYRTSHPSDWNPKSTPPSGGVKGESLRGARTCGVWPVVPAFCLSRLPFLAGLLGVDNRRSWRYHESQTRRQHRNTKGCRPS